MARGATRAGRTIPSRRRGEMSPRTSAAAALRVEGGRGRQHGRERRHHARVELRAGVAPQLGDRGGARHRPAVGAVGGHGVVGVAAEDDARGQRDRRRRPARRGSPRRPSARGTSARSRPPVRAARRPGRAAPGPPRCGSSPARTPRPSARAGLSRISFGMASLPTSWRRAANSSSWRADPASPSASATRSRELDDRARVRRCVVVVGLDDVGEQQHGAAVGAAQLERRRRSAPGARGRRPRAAIPAGTTASTTSGWSTATTRHEGGHGHEQERRFGTTRRPP